MAQQHVLPTFVLLLFNTASAGGRDGLEPSALASLSRLQHRRAAGCSQAEQAVVVAAGCSCFICRAISKEAGEVLDAPHGFVLLPPSVNACGALRPRAASPINSYQTKEQDADVHGEVKHHLGHLAHKPSQDPGHQLCITEDFKWKRQDHEEVRNHSVLEEDNEIGFTGYFKEDPHCQAVHRDPHQEQKCVE
ncbi:hypothetical protein DV515_00013218 [Chloebia gouldiae]|uniref:Uncharacterized protein n=1 Tax=Chloebia gouldiae TaxID=44316 RepID=A0A3L8S222_CHLGU|nr:hypothetical protein DV515_00013218 [Chloebia gouldiae]